MCSGMSVSSEILVSDIEPNAEVGALSRLVCIAVDFSANAEHALTWAIGNLLDPHRDLVVLLNVIEPASPPALHGIFESSCAILISRSRIYGIWWLYAKSPG